MTKKFLSTIFGLALLLAPVVAFADAQSDLMDQTRFSLFREAAAQVSFDSTKPACVVKVSASSVQVNEKFMVAWGAWGSQDSDLAKNIWAPTGAVMVVADTPGTYQYKFTFYGSGGAQTSCEALVSVR
jgi:hypothetical protein